MGNGALAHAKTVDPRRPFVLPPDLFRDRVRVRVRVRFRVRVRVRFSAWARVIG